MTPPSRAQGAALVYVPIIVGNIFGLRLLHATQQNCCVLRSRRLHSLSTSFSLKYIPLLVGNMCSLRGLHATQHNCCVLESRRLHPPKHKISLRLPCCSKCWQLIAPPIFFSLDKCFRSRKHRYEDITPPSTKTVPGSATPRHPVELLCAAMGDSTLTSNRAPDWYMSTSVCSISIIVGNRCSLRGLHTTQHNRCVLESRRLHPPKHKFSLRFSLGTYFRSREHRYDTRTSHPRPQKPSRAARLHATQ